MTIKLNTNIPVWIGTFESVDNIASGDVGEHRDNRVIVSGWSVRVVVYLDLTTSWNFNQFYWAGFVISTISVVLEVSIPPLWSWQRTHYILTSAVTFIENN